MIFVVVDDATAWYRLVQNLVDSQQFQGIRVSPPKQESYGALVTYAWDPCGVLLHFAQWTHGSSHD